MPTSSLLNARPEDVLGFWRDAGPSRWFRKDAAFDEQFRNLPFVAKFDEGRSK